MPINFLLLGGVVLFSEGGGGSANFIFMGVGIFPTQAPTTYWQAIVVRDLVVLHACRSFGRVPREVSQCCEEKLLGDTFCPLTAVQSPSPRGFFAKRNPSPLLWGRGNLRGIVGDNLGEGNCESLLGNIPVTTTTKIFQKYCDTNGRRIAIQMGGVLQYKWEAYCDTNGRSADSISLSSERRGTKSNAVQIGGVLQYKWEAYCDTFLRSRGGWGF